MRLAFVLWNDAIGGAELLTMRLARELCHLGVAPTLVFIQGVSAERSPLADFDLPWLSLELDRGRHVLSNGARLAKAVQESGPDGAVLVARGMLGVSLRQGGYRGLAVAVEHGELLAVSRLSGVRRAGDLVMRRLAARSHDAEVAVSDFMLGRLLAGPHCRRVVRIHNGTELTMSIPRADVPTQGALRVGYLGRLMDGKGVDVLIRAVSRIPADRALVLTIAGEGAELDRLARMVEELRLQQRVSFVGHVDDVSAFWSRQDVSVSPSVIEESFSMATLEAMAAGKAVIASEVGALPELLGSPTPAGVLVRPGDAPALSVALVGLADDRDRLAKYQIAARNRAEGFSLRKTAVEYQALFEELRTTMRRHYSSDVSTY